MSRKGGSSTVFDGLGSITNLVKPDGSLAARYQYDAWGNYRATAGFSFSIFSFTSGRCILALAGPHRCFDPSDTCLRIFLHFMLPNPNNGPASSLSFASCSLSRFKVAIKVSGDGVSSVKRRRNSGSISWPVPPS